MYKSMSYYYYYLPVSDLFGGTDSVVHKAFDVVSGCGFASGHPFGEPNPITPCLARPEAMPTFWQGLQFL